MEYNETLALIRTSYAKLQMGRFDRETAKNVRSILARVDRDKMITVSEKNYLESVQ